MSSRERQIVGRVLAAFALFVTAGCTARMYRQEADRAAYAVIREAQERSLGKAEPFTVEPAADALRRRLLIGQGLPYAGKASLGSGDLEPVPRWPEKDYPAAPPAEPSAEPMTARSEESASLDADSSRCLAGAGAGPCASEDAHSSTSASGPQPSAAGPAPWAGQEPLAISLSDALGVAARNNRDYQAAKESVFRAALDLDLEANQFRNLLAADRQGTYEANLRGPEAVHGLAGTATGSWQRRLKTGTLLTAEFAVDLAKLLTQDRASALGLFADATISIPLMRGAGAHIVTEPLTQAERDVAYAVWAFERFKRTLAVDVASSYLDVLRQLDQVKNAEENYRGLIASTRRARRMFDAGRLPQIQVDQALQDELRARDRWVAAQQAYESRLDAFKITLGLPADANISLDRAELERLAQEATALRARPSGGTGDAAATSQPTTTPSATAPITLVPPEREGGGPMEMEERRAIDTALTHRLDLRTALGRVVDAQRKVAVAADALRMGLTLTGSGQIGERRGLGSASEEDARLRFEDGLYTLGLAADLPLERTAERNAYRASYLALEQAVRSVQDLEDAVKRQVRDALRTLLQTRESYYIQVQAAQVAARRVQSTQLFLEAGRAEIRDVLEAQEALVSAQNALTAALVSYRVAELQLQRDMGVLSVDEKGTWHEYDPTSTDLP